MSVREDHVTVHCAGCDRLLNTNYDEAEIVDGLYYCADCDDSLVEQPAEAQELLYHGKAMAFRPTRVLCLQAWGPLEEDEPGDADIIGLLADGYSVFVELQPGDGTRYGLVLNSGMSGLHVIRTGAASGGSVLVTADKTVTPADCIPLSPGNEWSREFFAWWLNRLRRDGAK